MATIPQPFLLGQRRPLDDLERLKLVLDALPEEALMQLLEAGRGHGRNDYPVRPMWNSLIAGFVFQHRRECTHRTGRGPRDQSSGWRRAGRNSLP